MTVELEALEADVLIAIKKLTYREREMITLRYGLGPLHNHGQITYTYEAIGRIFKCTRERVRQIIAKAERKLQKKLKGWNPYCEARAERWQ